MTVSINSVDKYFMRDKFIALGRRCGRKKMIAWIETVKVVLHMHIVPSGTFHFR